MNVGQEEGEELEMSLTAVSENLEGMRKVGVPWQDVSIAVNVRTTWVTGCYARPSQPAALCAPAPAVRRTDCD